VLQILASEHSVLYHFLLQDSSDGSFYTLAFKELFPLDKEFARENVEPEKHEAYKSYQQALGKLTDDVISNTVKLKADTKETDLNVNSLVKMGTA